MPNSTDQNQSSRPASLLRRLSEPFFRLSKAMSRKGLYPFLRAQLKPVSNEQKVLSVGAGGEINRLLEDLASTHGFVLTQLDIDPTKRPDIVADICEWSAPETFDVVVMAEVLEHCSDPKSAIAGVTTCLKPGGRLVLTVPFVFGIHDAPIDYFRFTRHGLELLLSELENVKVSERNNWGETLAVLVARSVKADNRLVKLLSPIAVLTATVAYPLLWGLGRVLPARFITTGYTVAGRKQQ